MGFLENCDPLNVKEVNRACVLLSGYFLNLLLKLFLNFSALCEGKIGYTCNYSCFNYSNSEVQKSYEQNEFVWKNLNFKVWAPNFLFPRLLLLLFFKPK